MMDDGSVIEAWYKGGVRQINAPQNGHTNNTPVDVFSIDADFNAGQVEAFLSKQVGKKYDFGAITRFLSRRKEPADDKWFCSELVLAAFSEGGLDLLRGAPSMMSPRDLSLSPYLSFVKTIH
jgi:uncharacterized protein YycO